MSRTVATLLVCAVALSAASLLYYASFNNFPQYGRVHSVSAGGFHTCIVLDETKNGLAVKCFGDNLSGQLGLGLAPGSRDRPTKFLQVGDEEGEIPRSLPYVDLGNIAQGAASVEVSAGQYHTCAVVQPKSLDERTVTKCWGSNGLRWGQLGLGNHTITAVGKLREDMGNRLPPLELPAESHAEQISVSYGHSCIRLNTSRITCWGWNEYAQLGVGDKSNRHSPVPVSQQEFSDVIEVQTGYFHTCARLKGGVVRCFGGNAHGQLGGGDNREMEAGGVIEVELTEDASSMALGSVFGCALLESGNVECWGNLSWAHSEEVSSALLEFSAPAVQVSTGMGHMCALLKDGSVFCLGKNDHGQLGCDLREKVVETPCKAADRVIQIAAGHEHTCAVKHDHTLKCWGGNSKGQLGQGDKVLRRRPATVIV